MKEEKKEIKKINLYEKITNIKSDFLKENVKKSGRNKFANYTYYELADITPVLIELCKKYKIFTKFSYTKELATLEIVNIENLNERETYTSPMEELELKGCNKIQGLGGVETYQRRYLFMSAFDIIENDMFDAVVNDDKPEIDPKEYAQVINEFNKLSIETATDFDGICEYYKVKSTSDLTIEQLKEAIGVMKQKKEKKEEK